MVEAGPQAPERGKVELIQALRFIAALLVVLYHLPIHSDGSVFERFHGGGAGVDIFFVISDFVICLTALARDPFDARTFMAKRFWRIYPAFWAVLIPTIAVETLSAQVGIGVPKEGVLDPLHLVSSALLLPFPFLIVDVAWTLGIEITFYLLFALAYRAGGLRGVFVAILAWYAMTQVYIFTPLHEVTTLTYVLHSIVLEFGFGVAIGWLYLNTRMALGGPALILGALGMVGVVFFRETATLQALTELELGREIVAGIPSALLIYGAAASRMRIPAWLLLLGESSYILYLLHSLFFGVVRAAVKVATGWELGTSDIALAALTVAVVGVSAGLTLWVERPFLRWARRFTRSDARRPAPAE